MASAGHWEARRYLQGQRRPEGWGGHRSGGRSCRRSSVQHHGPGHAAKRRIKWIANPRTRINRKSLSGSKRLWGVTRIWKTLSVTRRGRKKHRQPSEACWRRKRGAWTQTMQSPSSSRGRGSSPAGPTSSGWRRRPSTCSSSARTRPTTGSPRRRQLPGRSLNGRKHPWRADWIKSGIAERKRQHRG